MTLAVAIAVIGIGGCFAVRPSRGGGQTTFAGQRQINASDVAVPVGYRVEVVAKGLTFPTGVAFDERGRAYVVEAGYSYGEVFTIPRLIRVESDGALIPVASGGNNGPWTGVAFAGGTFYVAEGGQLEGGRILRITPDGAISRMIEGLPSKGDHHTNGPAIGPDGNVYFGQGTATNSAVVGEDNAQFGWLKRFPDFHDIPCRDVTLAGANFESKDALNPDAARRVRTGAFAPFATASERGQVLRGRVPCSGAIMRISPQGGTPELIAWGFRNPFGLAFAPDGRLFVTDNSYDDRGSRPVHGAGDLLWAVTPGTWYGWPDFHGARRLDEGDHYVSPGKGKPQPVLATHPNPPPRPVAVFAVHSSSNALDFSREAAFGHVGEAFVAQFGDQAPTTGKVMAAVGFKVVRVNVTTGVIEEFATNKGRINGPASRIGGGGLERPVAARFDPRGTALYVVDFGVMTMSARGPAPRQETGVLWRITRDPRS